MKHSQTFCRAFVFGLLCLGARALAQTPQPAEPPVSTADGAQLRWRGKVLLDAQKDGFLSIKELVYAPAKTHFVVVACGYECNDNAGFLFRADGTGKRQFTARWDFILQGGVEWSADGRKLYYYRINSSGAEPPRGAPKEGWVEVDARTGYKTAARSRRLKTTASYAVFNVRGDDVLNVRASANAKAPLTGTLAHNAKGVSVTGAAIVANGVVWAPVQAQGITGWVNQNYLREERAQH